MRWVVRGIVALVVLAVLAVGALFAVPTERVASLLTDRISAATGRDVTIAGEISPTLWPNLGVRADDIRVSNPDWVIAGPMFTAQSMHVSVQLRALLGGELRLEQASLTAPEVTLMRAADGRESWSFGGRADSVDAEQSDTGPLDAIGFDRATMSDGRVRWIDEVAGQDVVVSEIDAVLSLPSALAEATFDLSARVDGQTISLTAAVDGIGPLIAGEVRNAALDLEWDGGSAEFNGRLSLAPALDGSFDLSSQDLTPILALAGAEMPELSEGLGRERIEASGRVTLTDTGSMHLRGGNIRLDDNRFTSELDMLPGRTRPTVRGVLNAEDLSIALMDEDAPEQSGPGGWPVDRIDFTGLFAVDADVGMRLGMVDLGGAEIGPIEVDVGLQRGRLVLDIDRAGVYGGRLSGEFVVNGRDTGSVGGDLILTGVQLNPVLNDFAKWDRLDGSGSASIEFLGVGDDIATIMASLRGQGDLSLGAGAIRGFDLAGMIRNFDASFEGDGERTVYDGVSANFTISNGVLSNDDLFLEAPWGEVQGAGSVDLGVQELDYRVIPGVMRDADGQGGVQVPVRITGAWSSPRFRPDLEFLAEQELRETRERLEAEAQALIEADAERLEAELRARADALLGAASRDALLDGGDADASAGIGGDVDAVIDRVLGDTSGRVLQFLGGAPPQDAATEGGDQ